MNKEVELNGVTLEFNSMSIAHHNEAELKIQQPSRHQKIVFGIEDDKTS
ncbi:hypothetical protein [Legionella sp. km535]|nr:hypothetical protein [Legionella sp. km535]